MSLWNLFPWGNRAEPLPQEIRIPQFVKDHVYLTVSGGLALIKGPKTLVLGGAGALFCKLVQSNRVSSQTKPLVDRVVEVIQPVVDAPMTTADLVALCVCMMFDDFAPFATAWIGFTATLILLAKQNRD